MKRIAISSLIGSFFVLASFGQKHDYIWLSGYANGAIGYDTGWGFYFGTSVLDFNTTPRSVTFDSSYTMNFDRANVSLSDTDGNLLFYTNGIYVANSLNEKIENSDSLNAGWFQYNWDPWIQTLGYRTVNGVFAFPNPGNQYQYFLIHSWIDSIGNNPAGKKLLFTLLDMSENAGHGKVINKNVPVVEDIIGWEIALTKHGNGKDWWALVQKRNSNCYYRILIDKYGVHQVPPLTCGSISIPNWDEGATCFSPDGNKYVYLSGNKGLNIFDFDRCKGELTNPVNMSLPAAIDSHWFSYGVAISPNNRFLYVSLTKHLYQFDLSVQDIIGSIDTVGIYDGTQAPFSALFHTMQLAPDGKIYMSCGNGDTVYHVINQPDLKGDSCDFRQNSLSLPSPSMGVPSFPNYRLGTLPGSPCDTLTGFAEELREKEKILKVFPSPATADVTIDYGFTDWSKPGEVRIEIVNELGQNVHQQSLPHYSGFQKLNVVSYPSGLYTTLIKRNHQVIATAKFAKQ